MVSGQGRRGSRSRRGFAAVVLAIALVAVGTGLGVRPAAAAPEPPARWSRSLRPLARQVERLRGLRFEHPVRIRFVTRSEFRKRLDAQADDAVRAMEPGQRRATEAVLRAFGLLASERTLAQEARAGDAGLVAAYYDPDQQEIVVRGRDLGPYTDVLLAHELTHALQDQHFGLRRLDRLDRPEVRLPFSALAEGDAMRVADGYTATLSRKDRTAVLRRAPDPVRPHVSLGAIALVGSPYVYGPGLVTSLHEAGGERAIDDAFRDPPDHTIEMVNPATLPDGVEPFPVRTPSLHRDEHPIGRPAPVGAFLMYAVLAARIDPLLAVEAADEWNGGTVRAFDLGNRDCARATFSAPADGIGAMFDAWSAWELKASNGAHVRARPGSITVEACAEESAESDADPVEVVTTLALRNEILLGALSEGISRVDAPCLANSLLEDEAAANALDALVAPDIPDGDARTVLRQRQAEIRRECAELSGSPVG